MSSIYGKKIIQKGKRKPEVLFKLSIVFTGLETNFIWISSISITHSEGEITLVFTLPGESEGGTQNPAPKRGKPGAGHTRQFYFTALLQSCMEKSMLFP